MSISLSMIVRNSEDSIERCLRSALPHVDELVIVDTGSTDRTMEIAEKLCSDFHKTCVVTQYEDPLKHPKWISNFAAARNHGLRMCAGEYVIWLDSDDELWMKPGTTLSKAMAFYGDVPDALHVVYEYGHNAEGHCTQAQTRLRVFRNGHFRWEGWVHENLVPIGMGTTNETETAWELPLRVVHTAPGNKASSAERNLWILEKLEESGEELTPHNWKGRADALAGLGRFSEAADAYEKAMGGEDTERQYQALVRLADCMDHLGRRGEALDCLSRAERLKPHYKLAYLAMAEMLCSSGQWEAALAWCDKADMAAGDKKSYFFNPFAGEAVPARIRGECYLQKGDYEAAKRWYSRLSELTKGRSEECENRLAALERASHELKMYEGLVAMYDELEGEDEKRAMLANVLPSCMSKFPMFSSLVRRKYLEGSMRGKKRICIFCGTTPELWGPDSIERGVGGSEEAAIYMSRELVKLGYSVELLGTFREDGLGVDEHGVLWSTWHSWEPHDKADIFIAWRSERACAELACESDQRWVWLQDVPVQEYYDKQFTDYVTGIICISKFQAVCLGHTGMQKAVVSANGLSPNTLVDGPNHSNKFIYASSPDRGLSELLTIWPKIYNAVPDAELHVFYGFRGMWLKYEEQNPKSADERKRLERLLNTMSGVHYHGMVGQPELHSWFAECGFWLYPTSFEETFCTTAIKAQAMGCIPITSRYRFSSLREVVPEAYDLGPQLFEKQIKDSPDELDAYADAVINASLNADSRDLESLRKEMKAWARKTYPWSKIAAQWHSLFSGRSMLADHQPHLAETADSAASLSPSSVPSA